MASNINRLKGLAPLSLFLSSYMPLFIIISLRQLWFNSEFLSWGGISWESIMLMIEKFGVAIICAVCAIVGTIGSYFVFKFIQIDAKNGDNVTIDSVSNMNDEPLAYLATYIVPIMFQNYSNWIDIVTMVALFYITYCLYIKSKLILVNPILGLKYHIYNFSYNECDVVRQGILISTSKDIIEKERVKIYNIGYQLYFGYRRN